MQSAVSITLFLAERPSNFCKSDYLCLRSFKSKSDFVNTDNYAVIDGNGRADMMNIFRLL
jgi:hypothetical protein